MSVREPADLPEAAKRDRITAEGNRTLAKLRALSKRLEDEYHAPLDAEQREQLHALLLVLAQRHEPGCALQAGDA